MILLEENFKWHLEAFASELFICILVIISKLPACICTFCTENHVTHFAVLYNIWQKRTVYKFGNFCSSSSLY